MFLSDNQLNQTFVLVKHIIKIPRPSNIHDQFYFERKESSLAYKDQCNLKFFPSISTVSLNMVHKCGKFIIIIFLLFDIIFWVVSYTPSGSKTHNLTLHPIIMERRSPFELELISSYLIYANENLIYWCTLHQL